MKKVLLFMILMSLFMVGCDGEEDPLTSTEAPFLGGSVGLDINFEPMGIEEGSDYSVYEDESFPIQLILKNKGEEDISSGEAKITLRGIDINDFTGISSATILNSELIEARAKDINPEGGEIVMNLGDTIQYMRQIAGSEVPLDIIADVDYNYKTRVTAPRVCFKEDLRDQRGCDVEGSKEFFNSGAPIQVKSVTEERAGKGIVALVFEVENVGGGRSTVPGQEFSTIYNTVAYQIEPANERALWKCRSGKENEARLIDNKATVRCTLNQAMPEGTLVIKEINLDFSYDYQQRIIQTLKVKKTI